MPSPICSGCRAEITGHFIKAGNRVYHTQCFKCASCGKPISGAFQDKKGSPYHPSCYQKVTGMICASCKRVLGERWVVFEGKNYHASCVSNASSVKCVVCGEGIIGSYVTDRWGHTAHAEHDGPCSSCGRILSKKTSKGGYSFEDGRFICGFCKKSSVESSWSVNRCKRTVLKELAKVGFKNIPQNVPLSLVSQQEFVRVTGKSHTKGLALSEVKYKNHKKLGMTHHIYCLYGLPKVEFMGVIAHELVHVWQNEHAFKLSSHHTEGLCNLASYWIYKKDNSDLAQILIENLIKNEDPIYGKGFRLMLKRWQKLGWHEFVKEILTQKEGIEQSLWQKIFG